MCSRVRVVHSEQAGFEYSAAPMVLASTGVTCGAMCGWTAPILPGGLAGEARSRVGRMPRLKHKPQESLGFRW